MVSFGYKQDKLKELDIDSWSTILFAVVSFHLFVDQSSSGRIRMTEKEKEKWTKKNRGVVVRGRKEDGDIPLPSIFSHVSDTPDTHTHHTHTHHTHTQRVSPHRWNIMHCSRSHGATKIQLWCKVGVKCTQTITKERSQTQKTHTHNPQQNKIQTKHSLSLEHRVSSIV